MPEKPTNSLESDWTQTNKSETIQIKSLMRKWTDLAIYKILCAQRLYDALNGYNSVRPIPVRKKNKLLIWNIHFLWLKYNKLQTEVNILTL